MKKYTIKIIGLLCLIICLFFACEQQAPEENIVQVEEKGIDVLLE